MRGSQQNCKLPYRGRVSKEELQDGNCFLYKLCNLTEEDSGTYDCYKVDEKIILTRSFSLTVHKPKVSGTPSLIGSNTIAPNSTGGADNERLITVTAVLAVIAVVGLCALLIFCLWKKGKCGSVVLIRNDVRYSHQDPGT
ncbi:hypothetical protein PHYPO_G00239040 [Pangasianodon hypophthalmus]|uniref:Immunoglobulin V-set domain-containing protein n=1 Tax=Pangasianodon hypophthalmus TaxID=310915 RepID=A0A5N5NE38_PANHP|nr:hypothetical protein PHYPO_G00239040 [Pangasianodon hypophthalmus]